METKNHTLENIYKSAFDTQFEVQGSTTWKQLYIKRTIQGFFKFRIRFFNIYYTGVVVGGLLCGGYIVFSKDKTNIPIEIQDVPHTVYYDKSNVKQEPLLEEATSIIEDLPNNDNFIPEQEPQLHQMPHEKKDTIEKIANTTEVPETIQQNIIVDTVLVEVIKEKIIIKDSVVTVLPRKVRMKK